MWLRHERFSECKFIPLCNLKYIMSIDYKSIMSCYHKFFMSRGPKFFCSGCHLLRAQVMMREMDQVPGASDRIAPGMNVAAYGNEPARQESSRASAATVPQRRKLRKNRGPQFVIASTAKQSSLDRHVAALLATTKN